MKRIKRAESQAPLSLYPRPQMVRDVWISLDGEWMFSFDDSDVGESEEWFLRTEEEIESAIYLRNRGKRNRRQGDSSCCLVLEKGYC